MTRDDTRDEQVPAEIRIGREHDAATNRWRPAIEITVLSRDTAAGQAPTVWCGPRWYASEEEAMRHLCADAHADLDPVLTENPDLLRAVRELAAAAYGPLAGTGCLQ